MSDKVYGYGTDEQRRRTYSVLENMWADASLKELKAKAGLLLNHNVNEVICLTEKSGNYETMMNKKFYSLAEQFIMYAALAGMFEVIPQYYYDPSFTGFIDIFRKAEAYDACEWKYDIHNKIFVTTFADTEEFDERYGGQGSKAHLTMTTLPQHGQDGHCYEFSIEAIATKYLVQLFEHCSIHGELGKTGVFYNKELNSYIITVCGAPMGNDGIYVVPLFARILKPYMARDFTKQELELIKHTSQMLNSFQKRTNGSYDFRFDENAMAETQEMMNKLIESLYTEDNRISLMDINISKLEFTQMVEHYMDLRHEYERTYHQIQQTQEELSAYRETASTEQEQMKAMCDSIMKYTVSTTWADLNRFIDKNKNILVDDNREVGNGGCGLGFSFYAFGAVQFFNEVEAEKFYENENSIIWRFDTVDGYSAIPRLFKGIFIDQSIQLNMCTHAVVNTYGNFCVHDSGYEQLVTTINDKQYLYNPHHYHYGCMGENEEILGKYIDDKNYIAFISQMITMAQSINLGDHCVFERFLGDLLNLYVSEYLIVTTPDGRQLTLRGANQYLMNVEAGQIKESEGQLNEQAS